jgi:CoA:oxalate CoA-transferase
MTAVALLAAYFRKAVSGRGQFIEISKQEAIINMQRVDSLMFANTGVALNRSGILNPLPGGGLMPCKDGHVVVATPENHQWDALVKLIGDPAWAQEDWCKDPIMRMKNAVKVKMLVSQWTANHTKQHIFREGQSIKVPVAPIRTAEDLAASKQLQARGFWTEMDHPVAGKIAFPASPYRFSKTPWRLTRAAPLLGEHNEEIYCGRLGCSGAELSKLQESGII